MKATEVPTEFGKKAWLVESGPAWYYVLLEHGIYTCECMGFLRWGYCKHVDFVRSKK
jgi:hypothetical protein